MAVRNTTLSLIMLTRNDAAHLTDQVRAWLTVFAECAGDLEVIIVDDASDDDTLARASCLAAVCDPVMVVHHGHKQGYGRALLSGLEVARGNYVVCLDSASSLPASDIHRLLPFLERYDLVVPVRLSWRTRWIWLASRLLSGRTDRRVSMCRVLLGRADLLRSIQVCAQSAWIYKEFYELARHHGTACVQVDVHSPEARLCPAMERYAQPPVATVRDLLRIRQSVHAVSSGSGMQRPAWQQKTVLGAAVALLAGGFWFFWRRRG